MMDSMASAGDDSTALRLTGRDALSLLHRISTNALLDLRPGEARGTLFCDSRGRLLHRAVVHLDGDQAVWLLRADAPGASLAAFLDRHVFRDDVRIEDHSRELLVWRAAPGDATAPGIPGAVSFESETLVVGAGPATPASELERIGAGRPAHGHEIVEEFNPFEVGLGNEVHLDKGCYTGQEALQRLTTYRSVRRALTRVSGRGSAPLVPQEVSGPEPRIGRLTSAVSAPGSSPSWVGLAVVRLDALDSGAPLSVAGESLVGAAERIPLPRPIGR
jgi:folate-binding protein YgfZ